MDFKRISELDQNKNYILFNTIYHKKVEPKRLKGKIKENYVDKIDLIFKNLDTGEKVLKEIEGPEMEIYVAKDDVELGDYVHVDIDKDKVNKVDVPYRNLLLEMARMVGLEDSYWKCLREGRYDDLNQIMEINKFFSCDRNIEDFYRYKSLKYFGLKDLKNITKGFLDIEADIMKGTINFKNGTGTAPINMISLTVANTKNVFSAVLRDPENEQIAKLENNIASVIKKIRKQNKLDGYGDFSYNVKFCDTEVELIEYIFEKINDQKLDVVEIWNMGFDIRYIMYRLTVFGVDPKDVICHSDFHDKVCYYHEDKKNFEIKKKTDYFKCSSYTLYIDQMINYASIRKSSSQLDSVKLDDIGELETGMKKLDYSDTASLRKLPYINFEMFFRYNIIDTLVQYAIDKKTNDTDTFLYRAYSSATRYDKIFKEITFLTNIAFSEFEAEEDGVILGNNVNAIRFNREQNAEEENVFDEDGDENNTDDTNTKNKAKKKTKFKGALVGDTLLILHEGKRIIYKRKSNTLFAYVVDFDFTSLYPTILRLLNVYKSTLLGQVRFDGELEESDSESRVSFEDGYNRGAQYVEDLESGESIFVGNRWLNLPSFLEVVDEFEKSLSNEQKYHQIKINKKKEKLHKIKIKKIK